MMRDYEIKLLEGKDKKTEEQKQSDLVIRAIQTMLERDPSKKKEMLDIIQELIDDANKKAEDPIGTGYIDSNLVLNEILDTKKLPNVVITDEDLQYALSTFKNDIAYIVRFDYKSLELECDDEGKFIMRNQEQFEAIEHAKDKETKIDPIGIDQPLLRQFFAAAMLAYVWNYGFIITVRFSDFVRGMGIDFRGNKNTKHKSSDFFGKLKSLEELSGVWKNNAFYRVFALLSYDPDMDILTFSSPWLYKVAKELLEKPMIEKKTKDGTTIYKIYGFEIIKPSIASARSKPTVEILTRLISGLKRYGVKPEAKRPNNMKKKFEDKELVEYTISFDTLIKEIPLVMENLEKCEKNSNKTTLLQRYFCGNSYNRLKNNKGYILEEYIDKYTYLKECYKDFKITFEPPTIKTLSNIITITHHGINGNFKYPFNFMPENNTETEDEEMK